MPQMMPLPWVMMLCITLLLVSVFLIMIFYPSYYTMELKESAFKKAEHNWEW